jgi:predicted RND superfamily exporter protein
MANFWGRFGGYMIRHHLLVTTLCIAVIGAVGYGVTRVRTNIDLMNLFDSKARILQHYQWLEANVGRLVPMEIVLRFDQDAISDVKARNDDETPEDAVSDPEDAAPDDEKRLMLLDRMEVVEAVQNAIYAKFGSEGEDVIGPPISPVTFVPPLPNRRKSASSVVVRSVTNTKLQDSYDALVESGYLKQVEQDGSELWRISVRVAAFKDVDYGRFVDELRGVVDPIVTQASGGAPNPEEIETAGTHTPVAAVYTGVVPIVYKAQRALLDSLIQSAFWSFVTITPLLMFVTRGILPGAVTMLPNVLPVLMVFGGMGWLGFPVDIGSMMSASIALGVAVDDTIHYLTWFREDLNESRDRHSAILTAYRRCATPTLQAALISGLGLSVFAFSTFTPTKQFGFLMLTILVAGVVAELVMLPALLAGPLGRVFKPRAKAVHSPAPPAQRESVNDAVVHTEPHYTTHKLPAEKKHAS